MNFADPNDRSAAAGEYVLGTLAGDERADFERALSGDPALQAEVYAWQDRLLDLSRRVAPIDPPVGLWQRIENAIDNAIPQRLVPASSLDTPRRDATVANDPSWRRVGLWQTISGLAIAASLVLATLLLVRAPPPAGIDTARYVAVLQGPDRNAGWIVEVIAGDRVRLVPIGDTAPPPPGKALQFWTKPRGAAGPTSLGLVAAGQVTELPVSRLPAVGEKQLFELTLEGETGSPIDRPTGPILFVGSTVRM